MNEQGRSQWVVHAFLFLERKDHGLAVYVLCVYSYFDNENDFPTRRWNTGREASEINRPRAKMARARLDSFWQWGPESAI